MGEFERIARLAKRFAPPSSPSVGIGHDCALLVLAGGATLAVSTDAAVEGVHFDRAYLSLEQAAERAVEAALSDLAAAGASVRDDPSGGAGIVSAITLPASLSEQDFDALIEGIARAAERAGAAVLGGNLARAPTLTLTTTVIGRVAGRALTRHGAQPGDAVYVTGVLGAAALGLRALASGRGEEPAFEPFVRAWRAPRARLDEGVAIARFAHAAVDVSDGLAQDAGHLARASGVAVVLEGERLPMLEGQQDAATELRLSALELALSGGEDYEVFFAAPAGAEQFATGAGWTRIGDVIAGPPGVSVREGGRVRALTAAGFDHFADRAR